MNAETVLTVWQTWIAAHARWVLLGWAHLFVGFGLAVVVLWDANLRRSRHARMWAWMTQLSPFFALAYLLFRPRERPLRSPFGVVALEPVDGPKRRPIRFWTGLQLAGIVPGLGHVVIGRPFRAVGYWLLMTIALTLFAFQRADVRRSWDVPKQYLPENRKDETVTVNFRVPPWLGTAMLVELGILIPLVYFDALSLAGQDVREHSRRRLVAKAYYRIRLERPDVAPDEFDVDKESLTVGSDAHCDFVVPDEGVQAHHATFYVHHNRRHELSVWVRCFDEDGRVRLNDAETHESELRPDDRIVVGSSAFTFLPLRDLEG
jgi:hypothetical protein